MLRNRVWATFTFLANTQHILGNTNMLHHTDTLSKVARKFMTFNQNASYPSQPINRHKPVIKTVRNRAWASFFLLRAKQEIVAYC